MLFVQPFGWLVYKEVTSRPNALALRLGRTLSQCVILFVIGCSASQQIATSATAINRQAVLIREEATQLQVSGETQHSEKIIASANKIISEVSDIHSSVPQIKDVTPAWLSALQLFFYAAIAIAVCVILWQTGLGNFIRLAINFLPQKKIQEASLLKSVLDDQKPETVREFVAAKRGADPLLDAAFRRQAK